MTDTPTPKTPAMPEPVAYAYLTPHSGTVYALSKTKSEQCPDGLVPATQLQEALDRADRAEAAIQAGRDAHLSIVKEYEDRAARDESALESALERSSELERDAERVSSEFEGDCWVAMRSLLNGCNYDWGCTEPDGVTAEDAREHISTTIAEMEKAEAYWKARAATAEDALAGVSKVIERVAKQKRELHEEWPRNMSLGGVAGSRITLSVGDIRDAAAWLSANPAKETPNADR